MRNQYLCMIGMLVALSVSEQSCAQQTDQTLITSSFYGGAGDDLHSTFLSGPNTVKAEEGGWWQLGNTLSQNLWISDDALQSSNPSGGSLFHLSLSLVRYDAMGIPNYSTYLGGDDIDQGNAIAMLSNNVIIGGVTQSANYPVTANAHNTLYDDIGMGMLTCLGPDGELQWSTFFEGGVVGLDTHESEAIYITGGTITPGLGTPGTHMESFPDGITFGSYLARVSAQGQLEWFTYYVVNDTFNLNLKNVAVSPDGESVYLYGRYFGEEGPVLNEGTHQSTYGGETDAFLASFSASDGTLNWETYFGGEGEEQLGNMVVDESGLIYISGSTVSTGNIASNGAYQTELNGIADAFLACFDPAGERIWSSYFGGEGFDGAAGVAIQGDGLLLAGGGNSLEGIAFGNPWEPELPSGTGGGFVTKWDRTAGTPIWGTYVAAVGSTQGGCNMSSVIALDDVHFVLSGTAFQGCAPYMSSNAWQPNFGGGDFDMWYGIYSTSTLSASNQLKEGQFSLYPNPSTSSLFIDAEGSIDNSHYTIYDAVGKVMMQGRIQSAKAEIPVAHLPKGLYLLSLEAQHERMVQKFVKE